MTRYVVMIRQSSGRMKIIANKSSRTEAQEIADREGGIVRPVSKKRKRR